MEAHAVTLAIFDLDNTLIGGDSDNLWGEFVCEQGLVDSKDFAQRNDQFYADYKAGTLDIDAYLRFALSALKGHSAATLAGWHQTFMASKIKPILLPKAAALLDDHRQRGHELLVITATNRFITEPIVALLGLEHLVACEGEIVDGVYTGEPSGVPSYHAGKVTRLYDWLDGRDTTLDGAWFYSDSHNDLPLLELVDNPVAVDPDDTLRARAGELGWPVISLR
jgi:HAD superfamily hydrolase (TIGR01490 family)